jgi:hypothetical protein
MAYCEPHVIRVIPDRPSGQRHVMNARNLALAFSAVLAARRPAQPEIQPAPVALEPLEELEKIPGQ